ncbi:hypothetical protein NDN08_008265 [Rhodosorus marinus]|uniref:Cobalamin biosynthesis protein CbiX n=1 Tax=Rhodosorus marinus TaxID=101924 RepID=A0AAV8V4L2_9RHOD|nr:hypothetical protein NDN08_008265 [Rhodosorus marinus]
MEGFIGVVGGSRGPSLGRTRVSCNALEVKKALLLVDHGSRRAAANDMLNDVKEMIVGMNPEVDIVEAAHMELADPNISMGIETCVEKGAEEIIVVPYFLSPGRHSAKDIPEMVDEASSGHPNVKISVAEPLGVHSKIGEVILERAGL